MTEERKLPSLQERPRRKGAASILASSDRRTPPSESGEIQSPKNEAESAFDFPATPEAIVESHRPTVPSSSSIRYAAAPAAKVQLGVKVHEDLKGRAKAAFKEAAYHEDVPSFEAFVAQALESEIRRIEKAHNRGERLEPRDENLKRGRPAL